MLPAVLPGSRAALAAYPPDGPPCQHGTQVAVMPVHDQLIGDPYIVELQTVLHFSVHTVYDRHGEGILRWNQFQLVVLYVLFYFFKA